MICMDYCNDQQFKGHFDFKFQQFQNGLLSCQIRHNRPSTLSYHYVHLLEARLPKVQFEMGGAGGVVKITTLDELFN